MALEADTVKAEDGIGAGMYSPDIERTVNTTQVFFLSGIPGPDDKLHDRLLNEILNP